MMAGMGPILIRSVSIIFFSFSLRLCRVERWGVDRGLALFSMIDYRQPQAVNKWYVSLVIISCYGIYTTIGLEAGRQKSFVILSGCKCENADPYALRIRTFFNCFVGREVSAGEGALFDSVLPAYAFPPPAEGSSPSAP